MKTNSYQNTKETVILNAMVVSDAVLARIRPIWEGSMFESKWANTIAKHCIEFFDKYSKAPGKSIKTWFISWAENRSDEDVYFVDSHLNSLYPQIDGLIEEINPNLIIDQAATYFNEVKGKSVCESAIGLFDNNKTDEAINLITSFSHVQLGDSDAIDLFLNKTEVTSAFTETKKSLIKFNGGLKKFYGDTLCRDAFVAFVAPEKTGKTFLLIDIAYRAMRQRNKVAFFEVGDMSKDQIIHRFGSRASKKPYRSTDLEGKMPCVLSIPTSIKKPQKLDFKEEPQPLPELSWDKKKHTSLLEEKAAWDAFDRVQREVVRSNKSYFKLVVRPNFTVSVHTIKSLLERWQAVENWTPDVVVIDYADILAMPFVGKVDVREQTNIIWKELRALSQTFHCLVVTASQSDAKGYDSWVLTRKNFSEDKRKLAHATGIVGINVKSWEKPLGVSRLNWMVRREHGYDDRRCCWCAGNLAIASPTMVSDY